MNTEQLNQGLSYDAYLEKAGEHRDFFRTVDQVVLPDELVEAVAQLDRDVYAVALSEGFCPDCHVNLPVLAKMASLNPKIRLRAFGRDANPELVKELAIKRIPTFVFFDLELNEIGRFVERPQVVVELLASGDPSVVRQAKMNYRQSAFVAETVREVLQIIK